MNFLSKILNRKKILIIILLFLVIAGFAIPTISNANTDENMTGNSGGYIPNATSDLTPDRKTDEETKKCIDNLSWYQDVVAGVADIILWLPKTVATIATNLSGWVITTVLDWPITNANTGDAAAKAFVAGWGSTRDLANMLVVLGFVIIGIAFTLRIEGYGTKKALINLIIVAILINFSGLFCGLIIDGSNITMKGLNPSRGGDSMGVSLMKNIEAIGDQASCTALEKGSLGEYITVDVMFGYIYAAIAFAFLYLALILLARYAILGILFILSPLAFVFWAFPFPKAKDLWNKWWEHFLKWAFIGVGVCFFLHVAQDILASYPYLNNAAANSDPLRIIQYLFVVIMVIVVGIWISAKSNGIAGMAAGAVMGIATGGTALAMGAVAGGGKGLAKMADKATGGVASSAAQNVKSKFGRTMENLGLKKDGSTDMANNKIVDEKAKGFSNAYSSAKARGDTGAMEKIHNKALNGRGSDQAAAMLALKDNNAVHDAFKGTDGKTNYNKLNGQISYAESAGAKGLRSDLSKSDPNLAGSPEKMRAAVEKHSPVNFVKNVKAEAMTPEVVGAMSKEQKSAVMAKGSKAQKKALLSNMQPGPELNEHVGKVEQQQATGKTMPAGTASEPVKVEAAPEPTAPKKSLIYRAGRATGAGIDLASAGKDYVVSAPGRITEGVKSGVEKGINKSIEAGASVIKKAKDVTAAAKEKGKKGVKAVSDYTTGEGSTVGWIKDKMSGKDKEEK